LKSPLKFKFFVMLAFIIASDLNLWLSLPTRNCHASGIEHLLRQDCDHLSALCQLNGGSLESISFDPDSTMLKTEWGASVGIDRRRTRAIPTSFQPESDQIESVLGWRIRCLV
jgi:hypothetical protein